MKLPFFILLLCAGRVFAAVELASVFSDDMVLQRGTPVPVWGWAEPSEKLRVEFGGRSWPCVADETGRWIVHLDPMPARAEPRALRVTSLDGDDAVRLNGVLVGDVWLCGGQSNMKWALKSTRDAERLIQSADLPMLRLLKVPKRIATKPVERFEAEWRKSDPSSVADFSAVGFLFGKRVQLETGVPIGLIMCAEGSTSVECWVSNETLESDLFAPAVAPWREVEARWADVDYRTRFLHKSIEDPLEVRPSEARTYPGGCFNGMLRPLFPFACKGVVWYQGEANRKRGDQYRDLFPAMAREWRERFARPDLRFYMVQLPEIGKPESTVGDSWIAELREAQRVSASQDERMEIAVIIDSDENGNIHPRNKQLPGERLARIALALDYDQPIAFQGPTFRSVAVEGNAARVFFDHAEGLMVGRREAPTGLDVEPVEEALRNFAVAGADGVFHAADAVVDGETVVARSTAVEVPVAVRYAWADSPVGCNLYNAAGLPAAPFRTDDAPWLSEGALAGEVLIVR